MAKEEFGEYAAFTSRGGIRFSHLGKMIAKDSVPPEVVAYLENKLGAPKPEPSVAEPKFPRPSEEELARMREESLKVPPELQMTPEQLASQDSAPLTAEDFDEPVSPPGVDSILLVPETEPSRQPTQAMQEAQSSFMESVSIHTASLKDMAQALYDRFGIYTVYLDVLPRSDEVNPLTGEPFTKYHQGIAYQAAIAAKNKGLLNPEVHRKDLDQGRAASANFQDQFEPAPVTMGDARRADSFAFRTSVGATKPVAATKIVHITDENGQVHAVQQEVELSEHGGVAKSHYDETEDEQILDPPIFGTTPIIKPDW
jgi:hypothetical protein